MWGHLHRETCETVSLSPNQNPWLPGVEGNGATPALGIWVHRQTPGPRSRAHGGKAPEYPFAQNSLGEG